MIYKRLGRTGLEASRLGFGAMRLPSLPNGDPDPGESIRIIHRAFELGVNYIDTAVMYCNHQSQAIVGQALKGWRDKVIVSTKNHYRGHDEKAWRENLDDSLRLLDVDYIDVYNFHGINWDAWEKWVKGPNGILSWMQKAQNEGVIRHICCSFHDNAEGLSKIVATGAFSVITLQYNLLDRSLEPVLQECTDHDMGVVVMGPVGGGRLGVDSERIAGMVEGASSTAEVALRFVLANPNVTLALSGMGTLEQVEENCAITSREEPLSSREKEQIAVTLGEMKGLADLYCTGCNYCMPCESGVDIPRNFLAVNYDRVYGLKELAQNMYNNTVGKASYCIACGKCEQKCPQSIPIRAQLLETVKRFDAASGTMALDLTVVRRTDEGLQVRVRAHNLSDMPGKAEVQFRCEDSLVLEPAQMHLGVEEPFKEVRRLAALRSSNGTPEHLEVTVDIDDMKGKRTEESRFVLGACYAAASLEDLCARLDELAPLSIRRDEQVLIGDETGRQCFEVLAWPGYTPEEFLLNIRLSDAQAAEEAAGDAAWTVDLVLDLRDREDELAPGFHNNMLMMRFRSAPDEPLSPRVMRGQFDVAKAGIESAFVDGAVELKVHVPWDALVGEDGMDLRGFDDGNAIGFDLIVGRTDRTGQPVFRAAWGANPHVDRDARTGVLFFKE